MITNNHKNRCYWCIYKTSTSIRLWHSPMTAVDLFRGRTFWCDFDCTKRCCGCYTHNHLDKRGLTAEEVAEVLQLPDGVDPLTFNPFVEGVDAAALEVEKVSQQIMTAVSSLPLQRKGLVPELTPLRLH